MTQWISWADASSLTGLPVPTIEHATRVGRIDRRPRHGARPTLDQDSVLAWADWYAAERAAIEARRRPQRRPGANRTKVRTYGPQPDPAKWVTTAAAAERLDVSAATIRRLVRCGDLNGYQAGRLWISIESVAAYAAREARWVSHAEAANVIGCSRHDVARLVEAGELAHRVAARRRPSIDRADAIALQPVWAERQEARQQLEREPAEVRRPVTASPDDGDVWLSTTTTAIALGISPSAVRQRAQRGTLPHYRTATRLWFRRRDVETRAAAQAFATTAKRAAGR